MLTCLSVAVYLPLTCILCNFPCIVGTLVSVRVQGKVFIAAECDPEGWEHVELKQNKTKKKHISSL